MKTIIKDFLWITEKLCLMFAIFCLPWAVILPYPRTYKASFIGLLCVGIAFLAKKEQNEN